MTKLNLGLTLLCLLSFNNVLFAQATDDNEINITQTGDTFTVYIDQYGYGNKIGGDDFSSSSSAMSARFLSTSKIFRQFCCAAP